MPGDVADSLRVALSCMSTFAVLRKSGLVDTGLLLNGEAPPPPGENNGPRDINSNQ